MSDKTYEILGPLLTEVGQEIAAQLGKMPDRAYMFVSCEDNWAGVSLYVDNGDHVISYRADNVLFDLAMKIWTVDNGKRPKKLRWVFFDYDIIDGKFETRFVFPEDLAPGENEFDWPGEGVKKRFGDKPLVQIGWDDTPTN